MGPQEVITLGFVLAVLALPMVALGDLLRQPAWPDVRPSKVVWAVLIVVLPVAGAALYLRRVRPILRDAPPPASAR